MWFVIMLFVASLAAAGAYWVSLATLPDDDALEERANRWRERLEGVGLPFDRIRPWADADGSRPWLEGLTTRLRVVATRIEHLGSRAEDLARRRGPRGERPEPVDAPTAAERRSPGASPILPAAAVAVESAPLTPTSALEAPTPERRTRSRLAQWSWPRAVEAAVATADDPTTDEAADVDGILYVPVLRDRPDAHSRLFGLLGIVVLVMVAGGVLALGVWQSIHLIARVLDNLAGT